MFFIASKVLAFLIRPETWIAGLLLVALGFRKRKLGLWAVVLAFLAVFVLGNQAIFYALWKNAEPPALENPMHHRYGVLLTGTGSTHPVHGTFQFAEGADRFVRALQYLQQDSIDTLIITGGVGRIMGEWEPEARMLKGLMLKNGVAPQRIITDTKARNTYENARNTAQIADTLPPGGFLLITSAYHIKRAVACFAAQGMQVTPCPADYLIGHPQPGLDYWLLPDAEVFKWWRVFLKEKIGMVAYRIKGYVG